MNSRIWGFGFGPNKDFNRPPEIFLQDVKQKLSIKCSAAEMITLVRFLGLIIGDLIEVDDVYWTLFKYLRSIIDIILSPRIVNSHVFELRDNIQKLNTLYYELFGKLKFKFHDLIHYPTDLLILGLLVNFWTMRFESRHRPLKAVATSISSTVNLLVSITTRETLNMSSLFNNFKCKNAKNVPHNSKNTKNFGKIYYKQIELNGGTYYKGLIIVVDNTAIEKYCGGIISIYAENNVVKFVIKQYEELYFDDHVHAYVLDENRSKLVIDFDDLPKLPTCYSTKKGGKHYVIPQYKL